MNRTTQQTSKWIFALVGMMAAGQVMAADIRYQLSGDYNDTLAVTGVNGWLAGGSGPGGLPGATDTARFNWGNNIVTLTNVAPNVQRFQMGVDESGQLIVESGGVLTSTGPNDSRVGNNGGSGVTGILTVKTNGVVNCTVPLEVGASANGILTLDGGTVNLTSHLWVGSVLSGISGSVYLTNGGTLNVGGNIGLGTINASTASGALGFVYVQDGGILNLSQIVTNSIQAGSKLDISGTGKVVINGNYTNVINHFTNSGKVTAFGGTGTVGVDYNNVNPGKTTLTGIGGYVPPTDVVWNPALNFPDTNGLWSVNSNWTGGLRPASVTKVTFNVPGAIPCTVDNAAVASYIVMGDGGPGGKLAVTNGGTLVCGVDNASAIGYNSTALMVVENGGSVTFGNHLWVGLDPGSDGTLVMNGGTVSVAGMFALGWQDGKGTARIHGGTLNLAQWNDDLSIRGESILDVGGTGKIVINGNHESSMVAFVNSGQITADGGTNTVVVDYNNINIGKTTVYPLGLDLPPAQVVWNPALNYPDTNGLWNVSSNWSGGVGPGSVTIVIFNVPDAIPCTITNAATARYVAMGINNGPGGTLTIANGGSLTCAGDNWTAVGYSSNALMVIENGGSATFGSHLWIGLDPGSDGTFMMNGGTATVLGMFGLGWQGGKGLAQINGGTLNLAQLHATDSFKGLSKMDITGNGTVIINGNQLSVVAAYIAAGKITANGGPNVAYTYDAGTTKTTLQVAPPRQSITAVTANGSSATITYQSTPGHIYHIEGTPSLSSQAWTRVTGSTTTATGSSVTFTFPASGSQMFYRTVSP